MDLNHVLRNSDLYLINWEKSINGSPILDLYNFYKMNYSISNFEQLMKQYEDKYPLEEKVYHRFNSVILEDNDLILTGLLDVNNIYKGNKVESMVIMFNLKDKKYTNQTIYHKKNDYIINKIIKLDKKILVGTSKSKCSLYGCEYEPLIINYK